MVNGREFAAPWRRVALLCVGLLACGIGRAATGGQEPVTVVVWDWHFADTSKGPGKWLKGIDEEFQRRHPNVRIDHVAKSHNDINLFGLHKKYPAYNFAQHKGYPTPEHVANLREHGPCPEHRRKPVNKIFVKRPRNAQRAKDRESEILELTREEAKALAEEAWANREFLSDWQKDFVGDVRRKLERGAEMTPRQNWFIRAAQREATKRARRAGEKV